MSLNPVKMIYDFNKKAGLLEKGYSDERECAFPIEEALEGLDAWHLFTMLKRADSEHSNSLEEELSYSPKRMSREIMSYCKPSLSTKDVDRLDKHLDIIVFSFGSIFKLGLTPQQALKALEIVMQANMQKLSAGTDSHGKQQKPSDFVGPEAKLQEILDKRVS